MSGFGVCVEGWWKVAGATKDVFAEAEDLGMPIEHLDLSGAVRGRGKLVVRFQASNAAVQVPVLMMALSSNHHVVP